ncbi:hypothetical protein [Aminobacter sp. DSM 101952]|uniref:hypothetical protein n=1 Tax=Aminobacter sp. DSM 101952 TaxID=2735891 RepID=UPI0012E36A05|nr:hypothetical protein [Aminobacter sp. DSM 101952]
MSNKVLRMTCAEARSGAPAVISGPDIGRRRRHLGAVRSHFKTLSQRLFAMIFDEPKMNRAFGIRSGRPD